MKPIYLKDGLIFVRLLIYNQNANSSLVSMHQIQAKKISAVSLDNIALNTYWDATKVMVNPPLDEVQAFRQMLASNTAAKEGEFDNFNTLDNSSKRKAITLSTQELEDIVGIGEFKTPQLSSSKGTMDIKSEIDKN
ncbi:hypothetical protein RIF29_15369 [Crotalaria pallida]|uniref:Uncharacterized protein n=1 Tax=Crotalaria pallida TaxID=3830 RepID=A0AAN9IJ36_CROPI